MLEAVVFDFDGVIVDTPEYYFKHMRNYFSKRHTEITDEDISHLIGHTFQKKIDFINAKYNLKVERDHLVGEINPAMMAEMSSLAKMDAQLLALLHALKRAGVKTAIASNNSPQTISFFLGKFGIKRLFDAVVTIMDVKQAKPDPETYSTAIALLGVLPRNSVALEDTSIGVQSARAAGLKCVAIPNKFTSGHDFSMADLVVKDFSALDIDRLRRLVG